MADKYADLTLERAETMVDDPVVKDLIHGLNARLGQVRSEQDRFIEWCDRADALYYPEVYTAGGADLWWNDPNVGKGGRSHVSVNDSPAYVDIPSALQAVDPIENMLATDTTEESRTAAAAKERVYTAWKGEESYQLKWHKAITTKALYGRTASRVYWDKDLKRPCVQMIDQPRNLFLGYKSDAYDQLEWAAYVQRMEPNAVLEEFGVEVGARSYGDAQSPQVMPWIEGRLDTSSPYSYLQFGPARVEVWDYWYRKPVFGKNGKFLRMETMNVVFAGNAVVREPTAYKEYKGQLQYRVLYNTFLPGQPNGRPELYDIEPLIRESYEKITAGSQMIASGVAGDYWQITGQEAPSAVEPGFKPVRNAVVAPGPGNRIETITPFIAQFQLEQYLVRIDRHKAIESGLNDLLLGLAPAQVLSSSKAINALIANYESRLSMRRHLLYDWRKGTWDLVWTIWVEKDKTISSIESAGGGVLDITDPSLSPRDEMETMTRALNAMNGKIAAQRTAMDWIGIDDPETEQDMIREERTDATMFPADVQTMAQLMLTLSQALGQQAPPAVQGQAQDQLGRGMSDLRTALGAATPDGTNATQGADVQGQLPPEALVPGATPPGQPFAAPPPQQVLAQSMIQGGKSKDRILTQTKLRGG